MAIGTSLDVANRVIQVTSEVKEYGKRKGVEILLPVESAEGTQVEADQLVQVCVVADGAVHVAVRRVGLEDHGCVRVAQLDHRRVGEVLWTVDDRGLAAAASDEVGENSRHGRVDVALVEDVDAAGVDVDAPLAAAGVELEVAADER